MKRIVQLLILILFAVAAIAAIQPAKAAVNTSAITGASCDSTTHTLTVHAYIDPNLGQIEIVAYVGFNLAVDAKEQGSGTATFVYSSQYFTNGAVVEVGFPEEDPQITTTCTEQACTNLDDRLNPVCVYPEQSAAVYCREGNIVVYAVNDSIGYYAFTVTEEELAKYPAYPEHNILIKAKLGARLYKLTSGKYQINRIKPDGKEYAFIFEGC